MKIFRKFFSSIIILFIIFGIIFYYRKPILKFIYPKNYQEYVEKYAKKYGVEEEIVYATIKVESNFNENATSNSNAKGLMQLLDTTAQEMAKDEEINVVDLFDAEINIMLGTKYIAKLIEKYGNLELAIAAYNAGIGNVNNWIDTKVILEDGSNTEKIPFDETNNYVKKVIRDYNIYKEIYN